MVLGRRCENQQSCHPGNEPPKINMVSQESHLRESPTREVLLAYKGLQLQEVRGFRHIRCDLNRSKFTFSWLWSLFVGSPTKNLLRVLLLLGGQTMMVPALQAQSKVLTAQASSMKFRWRARTRTLQMPLKPSHLAPYPTSCNLVCETRRMSPGTFRQPHYACQHQKGSPGNPGSRHALVEASTFGSARAWGRRSGFRNA